MSMQVGGGGGGSKSDINVTPLVDVMLVLLIIMMIVAPLLQQGVALTLPIANQQLGEARDAGRHGRRHHGGRAVPRQRQGGAGRDLRRAVEEALEQKKQRILIIKADEDAAYGDVMQAMDELRAAGIEDIGLITERRRRADGGRRVMAAPSAPRRRPRLQGQALEAIVRHEHHADDRRAARAARHLHGGPAAVAARRRHQPAGRRPKPSTDTPPPVGQIVLNYAADRRISINNEPVADRRTRGAPPHHLRGAHARRRCSSWAPARLRYGEIISVIDAAKGAGVEKVGIVTEGMRRAAGGTSGFSRRHSRFTRQMRRAAPDWSGPFAFVRHS